MLPSFIAVFGLMALLVSLSVFLERRRREHPELQDIFSPEIYQLGEMYQLGSPEAVYRINARAGIAFMIVWSLLVLSFMGMMFASLSGGPFFVNEHFQMPTPPEIMILFGCNSCFLLLPLIHLSVGIAGLVFFVRQQHICLYVYAHGLLLRKRRNGPVQAVTWEEISHVHCYTIRSSKGSTSHHCDITCWNGQRLSLNNYMRSKELVTCIDRMLVRERLPDLLQRYQQSESVSFGPYLSVNRSGIQLFGWHSGSYSWSEIDAVQFNDYAMSLFLNSRSEPTVCTLAVIENACLLRALVQRVRGE